jgi:hypothetical protein
MKEKNVLGKMYASEVKVELALVDDLKTAIDKVSTFEDKVSVTASNSDKANKLFLDAIKQKESILKEYDFNRKNSDDLLKQLNTLFKTISTSAKEIGIEVTSLPMYKEYLSAQDRLKSGRDKNQTAWELISKF